MTFQRLRSQTNVQATTTPEDNHSSQARADQTRRDQGRPGQSKADRGGAEQDRAAQDIRGSLSQSRTKNRQSFLQLRFEHHPRLSSSVLRESQTQLEGSLPVGKGPCVSRLVSDDRLAEASEILTERGMTVFKVRAGKCARTSASTSSERRVRRSNIVKSIVDT